MKTASIYEKLEFGASRPMIKVLFETDFTKEIRITMQKGTIMKEHKTKYPIVVHVLEGNIDFGVQGTVHKMVKGGLIALKGSVPHDLKANGNSVIRLTLSKSDDEKRVENVAI